MEDSAQPVVESATAELGGRNAGADPSSADEPAIQDTTGDHSDPVALVGYPRKREPRGVRRLYERPDSTTYVEIKVGDIVDAPPEIDDLARGQIAIWVRGDATVLLFELPVAYLNVNARRPHWPRH